MLDFAGLEEAARKEQALPVGAEAYEVLSWMLMRDLYRRFRRQELSHEAAKEIKAELRRLFDRAERERRQARAVWAQHQESLRLAGERWETIARDSASMADGELVDALLDIVSVLVGERVTAEAVRRGRASAKRAQP